MSDLFFMSMHLTVQQAEALNDAVLLFPGESVEDSIAKAVRRGVEDERMRRLQQRQQAERSRREETGPYGYPAGRDLDSRIESARRLEP